MVTARQEKSSEVGHEEIRDPWLEDKHAKCLYICTVGHVDRAVKHDGSKEANSRCISGRASKAAPDGEAEGSRHGAALPARLRHLGPMCCTPSLLVLGAAQKAGTDDSCSTLVMVINYQIIWCFPVDSCTTAERQIGILLCSFSSR